MTILTQPPNKIRFGPNVAEAGTLFQTIPNLSKVCIRKYNAFKKRNNNKHESQVFPKRLESYLPEKELRWQKSCLFMLMKHSTGLFPGFKFIAREFIMEEWLSLLDLHKKFHRDHIYHQTQVAVIANKLLSNIIFKEDFLYADELIRLWQKDQKQGRSVEFTLLDLTAYTLFRNAFAGNYFSDFITASDINITLLDIRNPSISRQAFEIWRYITKTALLTAAYYHDIGYPFQFANRIEEELNPLTNNKSMIKYKTDTLFKIFRSRLFINAIAGYRNFERLTRSDDIDTIRDTLLEAMRRTHGLHGAISFLSINDAIEGYETFAENKINTIIKEIAATAIMMHDMQCVYGQPVKRPQLRLSFEKDPISFILTLADQIQEYGRTSLSSIKYVKKRSAPTQERIDLSIERLCSAVEIQIINDVLKIKYEFGSDGSGLKSNLLSQYACEEKKKKFIPELISQYWNKTDGFMDYSGIFKNVELSSDIRREK